MAPHVVAVAPTRHAVGEGAQQSTPASGLAAPGDERPAVECPRGRSGLVTNHCMHQAAA